MSVERVTRALGVLDQADSLIVDLRNVEGGAVSMANFLTTDFLPGSVESLVAAASMRCQSGPIWKIDAG